MRRRTHLCKRRKGVAPAKSKSKAGPPAFASTPTQTVYSDTAYAPFGEHYATVGTTDLSFTGQNQDTASGVYDFLARELGEVAGRWSSPDPAGIAAVNPGDPQTWNRYAYVRSSPLNFTDPTGLIFNAVFHGTGGGGMLDTYGGPDAEFEDFVAEATYEDFLDGNIALPLLDSNGNVLGETWYSSSDPLVAQLDQVVGASETQNDYNDQGEFDGYVTATITTVAFLSTMPPLVDAPEVGSPEYLAELSGQVYGESSAGEKYILAPVAIADTVVVGVVLAPEAAAAARTGVAIAAQDPEAVVNFGRGFFAPPFGVAGDITGEGIVGNALQFFLKSIIP